MRVAIYSRYSSDLQDPRSIADQTAACRQRAEREGWAVTAEFSDAAISGASMTNRPGLQNLMTDAERGDFDAVLCESLDRLSRDMEDIAGLHKRLAFRNIEIITLADGSVSKLHMGLRAIIASSFLDDLALKTRRGQAGRVRAGYIPGGRCYGYDVVAGGAQRGRRTINAVEAEIVRRIFAEYVEGHSPLAIAARLNGEGLPAPRGGLWNASTINGSRRRQNGILSNSLYAGLLTYNRQRFLKDPSSGKRQARENPRSEWMTTELPELRIIDAETWEAAQGRRAGASCLHLTHRRRPKRLLSGLLRCGMCGGNYIVRTRNYVACSRRMNTGTCDNNREVAMPEIEERVLAALRRHLLSPEMVEIAVESYRAERERLAREQAKTRAESDRELSETKKRIAHVVAAIETGADPGPLLTRLGELELRRRVIEAQMQLFDTRKVVSLHPQAATRYREMVAEIHEAFTRGDAASAEAVTLVRQLIGEIRILPAAVKGEPVALEIAGDLAALMVREGAIPSVTASVVAGAGFEPTTFRL